MKKYRHSKKELQNQNARLDERLIVMKEQNSDLLGRLASSEAKVIQLTMKIAELNNKLSNTD